MKKSIFFLLAFSAQSLFAQSYKDHWTNAQLSFEMTLTGTISQSTCLENEKIFAACLMSMNQSLNLKNPRKSHYLIADASQNSRDFNGFTTSSYEVNDPNLKRIHKQYINEIPRMFRDFKNRTRLSSLQYFDLAFEKIAASVKNSGEESYQTGMIFNSFLMYVYDPHTSITPISYMEEQNSQQNADQTIFGFSLVDVKGELLISSVTPNSPAEKALLMPGDIIIEVEKEVRASAILEIMSNSKQIELIYKRSGKKKKISLKKAVTKVENVTSKIIQHDSNQYAYLKLNSFIDSNSCANIKKHLDEKKSKIKGIIIDLRDNGGGLVDQKICISDLFLEPFSINWVEKNLETGRYGVNRKESYSRDYADIPTVIMINGHSASASEALSSYLQAYRKAWILGETSFGKGTMQVYNEADSVLFKQTVARYYGPQGVSPQLQGVEPDFVVYPQVDQKEATTYYQREQDLFDYVIENDYQKVPVMEERITERSAIQKCLKRNTKSDSQYKAQLAKRNAVDYQTYKSLEVLNCHLEEKIPVFKSLKIPVAEIR